MTSASEEKLRHFNCFFSPGIWSRRLYNNVRQFIRRNVGSEFKFDKENFQRFGFRLPPRDVDENSTLLGCYAASSGNFLMTFRNHLLFPFAGVNNPKVIIQNPFFIILNSCPMEMVPIGVPETSVGN